MTATATVAKVSQTTVVHEQEWLKLFPAQVTGSYTSSLTFVKQLTIVAVSTITYLKNAFPEESYYSESFGGLKLKLLKSRCGDELAQFVSTAVQQAFEAFDNKYVHQLALCFYEGECKPENLIEYHVFEYSYNADGAELSINSKHRNSARHALRCSMDSVKARTMMLVRSLSLFVWQNCQQELPLNYDISLRLYYNEDAPEGYQAPGFSSTDDNDHLQGTAAAALCLGWVETPYHKLIARSFVRDAGDSDTAMPSDNVPQMTQCENEEFQGSTRTDADSVSSAEPALRCPCGKTDSQDQLIVCQYCQQQQHLSCFGLVSVPRSHCCERCADRDAARRPTDPLLGDLEGKKRECLCIFRRTLALCSQHSSLDGATLVTLFSLSASSAGKMLRLLQSHYILPTTQDLDLTVPRKINPLRLKLTFKRFFQMEDQDTIVDRLVAETAQVAFDPVAEVLTPEEKEVLRNSNLGTVVEAPENPVNNNDPTLNEYREAIRTNEDITEELPLSGSHNPVKDVEGIGKKTLKRKKEDDGEWLPKLPKLRSGTKIKRRG